MAKKQKDVGFSFNTLLLLLIVALLLFFAVKPYIPESSVEPVENVTGSSATDDDEWVPGGSSGGSSAPAEPDCWWQLIDEVDYSTLPHGYVDWVARVPVGDYKFTWNTGGSLQNIQIIKNAASIERFTDQLSDEYVFNEPAGTSDWGIGVENPKALPVSTNLRLYQWLCEDDPLNWESDLFDSPNMESGYSGPFPN